MDAVESRTFLRIHIFGDVRVSYFGPKLLCSYSNYKNKKQTFAMNCNQVSGKCVGYDSLSMMRNIHMPQSHIVMIVEDGKEN